MEQNETISGLFERRSVRVYEPRAVAPETKSLIIDAAIQAPTAGDMTLYTIVDVTDPVLKARLAVLCDDQPFIASAPMVLLFLADMQKWYEGFRSVDERARRPASGDLMLATADALIAAQNSVAAAWSLGVGSCYIGDIIERCEEVAALFSLPRYTMPAALLCYGYPTAQQKRRTKPARIAAEHIVCENAYRPWDKAERGEAFAVYGDAEKELARQYSRKWSAPFMGEMTRSVEKWFDRWNGGEM